MFRSAVNRGALLRAPVARGATLAPAAVRPIFPAARAFSTASRPRALWYTGAAFGAAALTAGTVHAAAAHSKTEIVVTPLPEDELNVIREAFLFIAANKTKSDTIPRQIDELRALFSLFAASHEMDLAQFYRLMSFILHHDLSEAEKKVWKDAFDYDNNGTVITDEFIQGFVLMQVMEELTPEELHSRLRMCFISIDADRSGKADEAEIASWLIFALKTGSVQYRVLNKVLGEDVSNNTAKTITSKLIAKFDENSDGMINLKEFQQIFAKVLASKEWSKMKSLSKKKKSSKK